MTKLTKKQRRQRRERKKIEYRREQRRKNEPKPWEAVKMKMFEVPAILPPDTTKEQRLEIIRNVGEKARNDFDIKYPAMLIGMQN